MDSCWAWNSGYNQGNGNGIKLGQANGTKEATPQRYINNCLLFHNKVDGFDNSEANILMSFYNNTVYRNGGRGYDFGQYTNPLIFKNNISYRNVTTDRFPAATVHDHNSWDASPSVTVSDADFVSVDTTGVSRKRVNGKLPSLNFLKLATGSDLVNAGIDVKLPYLGNAPDIGYNESSIAVTNIPVNGITVTGANGATTISFDQGTLQVSAAILPANATNKNVAWSVQNGTGQATISASGLVTALSNGTVTARATANDGSGVNGTLIITISNQTIRKSTRIDPSGTIMGIVSPNPFREMLTIDYNLPGETHVNLVVYDLNGRVVRQLVNETQAEGFHRFLWDDPNGSGNNLHKGIYILKIECAFGTETSKIIYSE